jgi:hypothetical protein
MLVTSGLLLFLLAYLLARGLGLRVSWPRVSAYVGIVLGGWYHYKKRAAGIDFGDAYLDWLVLVPVLAALATHSAKRLSSNGLRVALLGVSLVMGGAAYGGYNPLQSARPIFAPQGISVTPYLDEIQQRQGGDRLIVPNYLGAVLNGLGYPSVNHVLFAHSLEDWQARYPEIQPDRIRQIFGRLAIVSLTYEDEPYSPSTYEVHVPITSFLPPMLEDLPRVVNTPPRHILTGIEGQLEQRRRVGSNIRIRGWYRWPRKTRAQHTLHVVTDSPIESVRLDLAMRPDLAAYYSDWGVLWSGFEISFELAAPAPAGPLSVCLVVVGPDGEQVERVNSSDFGQACERLLHGS